MHLAAVWLEKEARHVSKEDRERTKHVVYALMYGAGKLRLAEILSVTVDQVPSPPPVPGLCGPCSSLLFLNATRGGGGFGSEIIVAT